MYHDLKEQQLILEQEARDIASSKIYRDLATAVRQGRFDETVYGNALLKTYYLPIQSKIEEYLDSDLKGFTKQTQNYVKLLCNDSKLLAYITLQTIVKVLAQKNNNVKPATLARAITNNLRIQQTFNTANEFNPKLIAYLGNEYRRASARRKRSLMEKHLLEYQDTHNVNTSSMEVKAGSVLIELVIQAGVGLIETKKVWEKRSSKYPLLFVSFTDEVISSLANSYYIPDTIALYPPMLVPPTDWTELKKGGYLSVDFSFVKLKGKGRKVLQNADFSKPMSAINKLQRTAWRVNKKIADIIYDVYDNNVIDPSSPPTLPRLYGGLPSSVPTNIRDVFEWKDWVENPTPQQRTEWGQWNRKREKISVELDGEKGRRIQYLMTMGVVEKMIDYDRFYYVYQLDYRGRVYPITDFFNPQSKGYVKAMLEFADGQYLTPVGLRWLKIHIANCYGLDKMPLDDRVKWAEDNHTMLLNIARSPQEALSSWVDSDSPYEFLAGCMAYEDHILGNKVHLPIQLDAVNSGVQIYSGLLLDKKGAASTCVIGQERADLYREVADLNNHKLEIGDYPKFIEFTTKAGEQRILNTIVEATSLRGKFTRSMTKPNVMTLPYSVTPQGMMQQNLDIMDEYVLEQKDFWKGDGWVVNKVWTDVTLSSINEIVKGAKAGQVYLRDVAKLHNEPIMWHTPIYELPVFQALYNTKQLRVKTVLGTLSITETLDESKKSKQLSSIAANYIHSIDATLLFYVVDHLGADIGTIHDCFLVHPNQGEEVRRWYREAYVMVMSSKPLEKFSNELDPEGKIEIPYINTLDLEEVYKSEYIIS